MKKILFIHDHYFKYRNGIYYSGGGLPDSIWKRYLAVFPHLVVVGRDGGKLSDDDVRYTVSSTPGVEFILLPNVSNIKSFIFGNPEVQGVCRKLVAESDGLIARMPSRLAQLFVSEAIRQKKPYAVEVVGCAWGGLWDYGTWKAKLYAPISAFNARRVIKSADFALYVTENYLQQRYPSNGVVTFCSNVDIAAVSEKVLESRLDRSGVTEKLTFGLIGNYSSKYKGIDIAIRALADFNKHGIDWQLEVVGGGNASVYQDLAQELGIWEKVRFLGTKPAGSPIYEWLDGVDIYLQPSYQEGLPRALIEAMSRGCPSIGTSIAGIPELLSESEMIAPGDWQALSEKIFKFATDPHLMSDLACRNFNVAKKYYRHVLDDRRTKFWAAFASLLDGKAKVDLK